MNRSALTTLAVVAVLVLAAAFAWHWYRGREAPPVAPMVEAPPPEKPAEPRYPVPEASPPEPQAEAPAPKPLPKLEQSDAPLLESAAGVFGEAPVERFLVPDSVIRRIVVTVDNLPDSSLGMRFRAIKRIDGGFDVETKGEGESRTYWLSPDNYARYDAFVAALRSVDSEALVGLYFRYYPLFQEAYRELGYPSGYFNDRVIEVIDHLLATPEVAGAIELVRPKVLYQYKNPDLEALSVGQKTLIRMGPQHARAVKAKLRALRAAIIAGTRQDPPRTTDAEMPAQG